MDAIIVGDLEDDPDGNVRHVAEHGLTIEEGEDMLLDRGHAEAISRSSGRPIVFGWTSTGRHIAVVWEVAGDECEPSGRR